MELMLVESYRADVANFLIKQAEKQTELKNTLLCLKNRIK